MIARIIRPNRVIRGPVFQPNPVSSRRTGSSLRLQAQVADVSKGIDTDGCSLPAFIGNPNVQSEPSVVGPIGTPPYDSPGAAKLENVLANPVSFEIQSGRDEFWRKVPYWADVTAKDFLSYRWSVSEM